MVTLPKKNEKRLSPQRSQRKAARSVSLGRNLAISLSPLWLIVCSFFLCLPACGQKVERNPNSFVESSIGDARRLNPVIANDAASGTINDLIFNGLVKYDK